MRLVAETNEYKKAIFDMLKDSFRVDFSHYKPSTINRRINRRMVISQKETLKNYTEYLKSDPQELQALYDSMLIGVTSFFREPSTFNVLQHSVYPKILAHRATDDPVTVWVPGCSTGEETYSIAISLQEYLETQGIKHLAIKILGSDVNQKSLGKACEGQNIKYLLQSPKVKFTLLSLRIGILRRKEPAIG
jgi:two-component system CheB/CheR fusion protein